MIVTRLTGGLGNQMFQYAAGLALAHRRRTVLKLDVSWYREHDVDQSRYALDCFNLTGRFATMEEIDRTRGRRLTRAERWSVAMARRLRFRRYAEALDAPGHHHVQPSAGYDAALPALPDGTYLDGLWQSERYFAGVEDLLRRQFTPRYPQPAAVADLAALIAGSPSIAVHFRRGDYVSHPGHSARNGALPLDYYHRAIAQVLPREPRATLYIFSDDLDEIERRFQPAAPHRFVRAAPGTADFDQLRLMSLCRHCVIANSTFSWWAAWLNPHPGKIVIGPRRWFADPAWDSGDILPTSWEAL